jgi:hypothetical protein
LRWDGYTTEAEESLKLVGGYSARYDLAKKPFSDDRIAQHHQNGPFRRGRPYDIVGRLALRP